MWALLGIVLKYVAAAGAAYSAYSGYETNKAQAKQAEYNAEHDAKAAANAAEQERANRGQQERAESKELRRRRASIEAAYAKSGVLIEGTPTELMAQQAAVDELNIQQRSRESKARSMGLEVRSKNALIGGKASASSYRAAATGSLIQGIGRSSQLGPSAASSTHTWLNEKR